MFHDISLNLRIDRTGISQPTMFDDTSGIVQGIPRVGGAKKMLAKLKSHHIWLSFFRIYMLVN